MRTALLLTLVALAAAAAIAPAAQAQAPPPLPCGAYAGPDPTDPHLAFGCGTFACYVNEDYGLRCFG